mmetsp:Transcript_98681/g.279224  ORF Transcript_98681/g.279224 Transcript_98681/m.279224 type:complete len:119 (-) Transcript_98681:205-561(-)
MPHLRNPTTAESDVARMPIHDIRDGWFVIHTKDGRPYYHHPESGTTQWAHPRTKAVAPPVRPPENLRPPNPKILWPLRVVGGSLVAVWFFGIFGGSPLLGKLLGEGSGSFRVVEVHRP